MYKVLIADDEAVVRRGIVNGIDWAALGCIVVGEAANGLEGIEVSQQNAPDLIITDVRMPQMDGLSMMTELRRRGSRAHVIVLTAYSDFEYARKAIGFGAEEYLLKPFDNEELIRAVNKVLENERRWNGSTSRDGAEVSGSQAEGTALPEVSVAGKSRLVRDAVQYIAENYARHDLGISAIAEALEVSEGHLSHAFKKETGYTVGNYLTLYRMRKAVALLLEGRTNRIYEVASAVGYRDVTYFSNVFKKYIGKAPTEIRDR